MAAVVAVGSSAEAVAVARAYDEVGPFADGLPFAASAVRSR